MRLLRDREYLPALLEAIREARKEIDARIFLIDTGREGERPALSILKALRNARKRNVQVRILTDGIFRAKPSGKRLKASARKLGLPVKWDSKSTTLHEKSIRIDKRIVILGSHNWTSGSLMENHELSIAIPARQALLDAGQFSRSLLRDVAESQKEITLATFDIDESANPYDFSSKLTRSLIEAKGRGVKVRVLIDAWQVRVPQTGEILYHYRGLRKAEELARAGVHVYYDPTTTMFHAKTTVIDDKILYVGSQNLEMRRDVTALEASVRIVSKKISGEVTSYLARILRESFPFHSRILRQEGLPLPISFFEKDGVFSRMFKNQSEETFRFYISLLREAWKTGSNRIERKWPPSLQDDRRRLIREYRLLQHEAGRGMRPGYVTLTGPESGKPFAFPEKDLFIVPDSFFDFGWFERLRHREIFLFWIHLAESQHSSESPFWSMSQMEIVRKFGMDRTSLTSGTIALERWNLIEVIRDPKIVFRNVLKRPNRYRVNPLWSPEEHVLAKKKMMEELSMSAASLKEAEELASRLNQPNDLEVIRKFLLLMERYGLAKVKRATRITARFKPHFALRNVHHTAAILRNWASGVYK